MEYIVTQAQIKEAIKELGYFNKDTYRQYMAKQDHDIEDLDFFVENTSEIVNHAYGILDIMDKHYTDGEATFNTDVTLNITHYNQNELLEVIGASQEMLQLIDIVQFIERSLENCLNPTLTLEEIKEGLYKASVTLNWRKGEN